MAASAGTVTLELDANSVKLLRELNKTQRQTQRTANKMQRSMVGAFKQIRQAARTAAAAMGVFAAARTIRGIAEAGIQMERLERGLRAATGSGEAAAEEMAFLRAEADRLGLNLQSAGIAYTKLAAAAKGTALQGQASRDIFVAVSEASRVMGLSADQTQGALTALEQIISKGKVSAEELRGQLGERLPGAFQIAARSIGKTTAELDTMLRLGQLTAEELLPSLATELRATFGSEVENAANDAQAAFNRFANSIFEVKAAFADSGLLDILSAAAGHLTTTAQAVGGFLTTTLEERAEQLRGEISMLEDSVQFQMGTGRAGQQMRDRVGALRVELELTEDRLAIERRVSEERERQKNLIGEVTVTQAQIDGDLKKIFEKNNAEIDKLYERFVSAYSTAQQAVEAELSDFDMVAYLFPDDERARIRAAIRDSLRIDEIDSADFASTEMSESTRRTFDRMKKEADEVGDAAKELGLTFASAFEDAIVEGEKLSDVLKGLLKDILRMVVRQTITEPLANAITGAFSARAMGGPVSAGETYLVGERGQELFVPSQSGTIIPNHKLQGSAGIVNHYNFQAGADVATIRQEIIPLLEQNKEQTKAEVLQSRREGRGL